MIFENDTNYFEFTVKLISTQLLQWVEMMQTCGWKAIKFHTRGRAGYGIIICNHMAHLRYKGIHILENQ